MVWVLYEALLAIGFLLYLPRALRRRRLLHRGWAMRLGRYPLAVRQRLARRPTLWIHAVSVGEALAVGPLIRALGRAYPNTSLVLSTVTPGGYDVASRLIEEQAVAIYAPLDFRLTVKRALDAIRPKALLLVESELWPNLVRLASRRDARVALVNGRISARAFRRYRLARPWVKRMLDGVTLFLMQSDADAGRLLDLGVPTSRIWVTGSLKWDASLSSRPDPGHLQELRARLGLQGDVPLIVAGSTHRGEEAALLEALGAMRDQLRGLRMIIAPRHLERTAEVEALAQRRGLRVARISRLSGEAGAWDVALVDTLGQLPSFYGLASVVFVGGSLIPHGGQNPLEPASLGKPVVFGPSMHNFADIAQQLLAHQAARQLSGRAELVAALRSLLSDREEASLMGARAQALVERLSGVSQRTCEALTPLLDSVLPR